MPDFKAIEKRILPAYKDSSASTINQIVSQVGSERFLHSLVRGAEPNIFSNKDTLRLVAELKRGGKEGQHSSAELATALMLVNNGIAACWDYVRILPTGPDGGWGSTVMDFFTNVKVGGRNLAIEVHSFDLFLKCFGTRRHRDTRVAHELEKRALLFADSNMFVVFVGDISHTVFMEQFRVKVGSFCDYYVSGRDVVARDGRSFSFIDRPDDERRVLESKRQFQEVFGVIPPRSLKAGLFMVRLPELIRNIMDGEGVVKVDAHWLHQEVGEYFRKFMLSRIVDRPTRSA